MSDSLDLKTTYRAFLSAAREERLLTFGDIAKANEAEWTKVRRPMRNHLFRLMKYCVERGWPILGSIVIDQKGLKTGNPSPEALKGFVGAATDLGVYAGSDPITFLEEQRTSVFEWAPRAPEDPGFPEEELPGGIETSDHRAEPATSEVEQPATYGITNIVADGCFLPEDALSNMLVGLKDKKNLILQGPPGTGKTWLAKRLGYALIGTRHKEAVRTQMRAIQFHPSMSYEDFVRGWRPGGNGQLRLADGVFLEAIRIAHAEPDRPFVFVVEEINRGNPAQVFGEMLTLLEKDKRREDEAIELAYRREDGERVHVPENFYVIGTMNIADRSLALVDYALRRRFAFVTLEPELNRRWENWCRRAGIDNDSISKIKRRMGALNNEIANDRSLGAQFRIGHSFVTPAQGEQIDDSRSWFLQIARNEIGPLLEEYWFDNPDKAESETQELLKGW